MKNLILLVIIPFLTFSQSALKKTYWANGNLKSEEFWLDNWKCDGSREDGCIPSNKYYYSSGELKRVEYVYGYHIERISEYHKNGKKRYEADIDDFDMSEKFWNKKGHSTEGLKIDELTSPDDSLYYKKYDMSLFNGLIISDDVFSQGVIGECVNGKKDGVWNTWNDGSFYDIRKLKNEVTYDNGELLKGTVIEYWSNGKIYMEWSFKKEKYQNNYPYHGVCKTWYSDGSLLQEVKYNNGIISMPHNRWYESGELEYQRIISNKEIKVINWFDSSYPRKKAVEEIFSENGQLTNVRSWYPNGKEKLNYRYASMDKNDDSKSEKTLLVANGLCRDWYENGQLKMSVNYHKGEIIDMKCYSLDGKTIECADFSKIEPFTFSIIDAYPKNICFFCFATCDKGETVINNETTQKILCENQKMKVEETISDGDGKVIQCYDEFRNKITCE